MSISPYYLSTVEKESGEIRRSSRFLVPVPGLYQLITDLAFSTYIYPNSDSDFSSYKDNKVHLCHHKCTLTTFDLSLGYINDNKFIVTSCNEGIDYTLEFVATLSNKIKGVYISCPCLFHN